MTAPEHRTAVLEMRGIRKTFPGVVALDGVDLTLYGGEVHMLLGENGAGKSTLIKILSGAYRKDAGAILLHGAPVDIQSPRDALARGIRVDLSGAEPRAASVGCGEHFSRRGPDPLRRRDRLAASARGNHLSARAASDSTCRRTFRCIA